VALELAVVDAFTDRPFAGNPAAVAIVDRFPAVERMQLVAREMNLSETAFVERGGGGREGGAGTERGRGCAFRLRWFTPTTEVDLCGHATLAAAHVLGGRADFDTRSGLLRCEPGAPGWTEMDFPADPPIEIEPPAIELGVRVTWWGRSRHAVVAELDSAASVRAVEPDLAMVATLDATMLVVTAPADEPGVDCVTRVFGPKVGIPEDPVTGSAHCVLAPHWYARVGRRELVGLQASPRGGTVRMRDAGERVVLAGQAVTVATVTMNW
jgi:predicted PhzF superfamily epimerase YddE/YHI9